MPYSELTKSLKELSERLDYVDAFYIHGSRAVGRNQTESDIDYCFLIKSHEKRLIRELNKILGYRIRNGWYPDESWPEWSWNNLPVGVHILPTTELSGIAETIFSSKDLFIKNQTLVQFLIVEAKPVFDPAGIVKKHQKIVSDYPDTLSKEIVNDMLQKLEVKLEWIGEKWIPRNRYSFINDIKDIVVYIATAHHAKNKAFMMNSLKAWHHDMKKFSPYIKKDLDRLIAIDVNFGKENKAVYLQNIIRKLKEDL